MSQPNGPEQLNPTDKTPRSSRRRWLIGGAALLGTGVLAAAVYPWSTPLKTFRSSNYPYQIDYPGDWNALSAGGAMGPADLFVPQGARATDLNVSVDAYPLPNGLTLENAVSAFLEADSSDFYNLFGEGVIAEQAGPDQRDPLGLNIVGRKHPAYRIAATMPRHILDTILFVTDRNAWAIRMMARDHLRNPHLKTLKGMVDSFVSLERSRMI